MISAFRSIKSTNVPVFFYEFSNTHTKHQEKEKKSRIDENKLPEIFVNLNGILYSEEKKSTNFDEFSNTH